MTMPHTRLSTRLSGSAKETESRIRNIFQGQHRRPPALLMVLLLCAIALCGSLVACRSTPALQEEPAPTPDPSPTVSPDPPSGSTLFTADLNHNGVPETLEVIWHEEMYYELTVTEGEQVLYTAQANTSHAGWNSLFLYRKDGEDFLLQYLPTMYQGFGSYGYRLFCLNEDGSEAVVRENSVQFDLNFGSPIHEGFDPEAIAAFMDDINNLLADSTLLMNTDPDLAASFERNGAQVDDLWWLDAPFVFTRDREKSLPENLWDFQTELKAATSYRPAVPFTPDPGMTEDEAARAAFRAVLEGRATFYFPETDRNIDITHIHEVLSCDRFDFSILDLDGDGVQEAVLRSDDYAQYSVILHWDTDTLYGYSFYIRSLNALTLKEDGTFSFSSSAFEGGWGRLSFSGQGCTVHADSYCSDYGSSQAAYVVDGQPVTQAEFDAAQTLQDAKPDAVWSGLTASATPPA